LVQGYGEVAAIVLADPEQELLDLGWGAILDGIPEQELTRAETSEALMGWTQRHAPKPFTTTSASRFWDSLRGASGQELPEALVRQLGWRPQPIRRAARHLGGCLELFGTSDQPNFLGLQRMDFERVRWVLGQGDGFIGLWDWDGPTEPVQRWPATPAGAAVAREAQKELVDRAIVRDTRLPGQRTWARRADRSSSVLVHLDQNNVAAVIATGPPPGTMMVTPPGYAMVGLAADRLGIPPTTPPTPPTMPITNMGDAQFLVENVYLYLSGVVHPWRPVPEEVDRGYLATVEWVNEQAARHGSA
jgi:hypothetical protein